ncbi:hypothetical protein RK21_03579 [Pseudomonas plecoglossicida]|nr:hypothetical protein RK21_03579 [Pseudomonas plecoglossicida]
MLKKASKGVLAFLFGCMAPPSAVIAGKPAPTGKGRGV